MVRRLAPGCRNGALPLGGPGGGGKERGAVRASDHMKTVRELEQQYEASIGAKDGT